MSDESDQLRNEDFCSKEGTIELEGKALVYQAAEDEKYRKYF